MEPRLYTYVITVLHKCFTSLLAGPFLKRRTTLCS